MQSALPSRRLLATLAFALTLLRHHQSIRQAFHRIFLSFRRLLRATQLATLTFSQTSQDIYNYVQPVSSRRAQRVRRPLIRPYLNSMPRSIRRIFRILASEDALAVVYNIAGGAARGFAKEMRRPSINQPVQAHVMQQVVDCLASSSGQKLVSNTVSTAVREGVHTFLQIQREQEHNVNGEWVNKVVDAVLSEKGQAFVLKLTHQLSRSIIPALVQNGSEQNRSSCGSSAQMTPVMKQPMSFRSQEERTRMELTPTKLNFVGESPVTRRLVSTVMQTQGRMGTIERLALLAIRDKELVREVVRTVVAEAVRTYLKTQAELGEKGDKIDSQKGVKQSLWKMLLQSAALDVKRAMLSRVASTPGWLVF